MRKKEQRVILRVWDGAIKWMVIYIETRKTGREAGLGEGKSMFLLKNTGLEGKKSMFTLKYR